MPDAPPPEIPRPDDRLGEPVPAGELISGGVRAAWPWLLGGGIAVAVIGLLLWGANTPDDPVLEDRPADTVSTPADGLAFTEIARQVGEGCLKLLLADSPEERSSGLRYREAELDRVDGMLFSYEEPQAPGSAFTMAGVVEPLDIGFYGAGGERLGGHEMVPCEGSINECRRYETPEGFQFAIETAPGKLPDGPLGGDCTP